jgi:MFS family permease
MGTFPPAIFLHNNNFDLNALASKPGWSDGGPNVHTFSIVTWITAVVMTITKNPGSTFLILHLLTFITMAWALHHLFRIAEAMTNSSGVAIACCFSTLLCPIVLVQTGYMYTEIPVFACSTAAISAWFQGRKKWAVFWCGIGMFMKASAIVPVIGIALALIFGYQVYGRYAYIVALAIPVVLKVSLLNRIFIHKPAPLFPYYIAKPFASLASRLYHVPDVSLMLFLGWLILIFRWHLIVSGIRSNTPGPEKFRQSGRSIVLLLTPLFILGIVFQLKGHHAWFLPRYATIIIPFALLTVSYILFREFGKPIAIIFFLMITVFFLLNHDGHFYPSQYTAFSIVERSHQYRHFQQVQTQGLKAFATKPKEIPGYYCRDAGYMASDPMMGYLNDTIPNTYPIYFEPYKNRKIEDFPDQFYLLLSNKGHGCEFIERIMTDIKKSADWKIQSYEFSSNGFRVLLYELKRKSIHNGLIKDEIQSLP